MRVRSFAQFMVGVVALTCLPVLGSVVAPSPASAHQDGCHAAHSCPSDSGSYVCGDTGNDSECGIGGPEVEVSEPEPVDYSAPPRPKFAAATTGPRGLVRIPVRAEQGSRLVIKDGRRVVATATGTGALQTIAFYATTGAHTYRAVATDAAGNRSLAGTVSVEADATRPVATGVELTPGSPSDSRSHLHLVTDPDTKFRLDVDGRTLRRGITVDGDISEVIDLANGRHKVALELRDQVGNVQTMVRALKVRVANLRVTARALSDASAGTQVFRVEGTPNARGTLQIPGGPAETFRLTDGTQDVPFDLPDGDYAAPVVTLVDRYGRRGSTQLSRFVVDTAAPALVTSALRGRASEGVLAAVITSEVGSTVVWRLLDARDKVIWADRYVADATEMELVRDVAEGDYQLQVTATDPHGNQTTKRVAAHIAADPLTAADAVYACLAILLLLAVLLALVLVWRRNRNRLAAWREQRRVLAAQRRRARQHAAAMAAHARAVARYDKQVAAHEREDARWRQRRAELADLLELARTAHGSRIAGYLNVKLRRGERVYCTVSGSMVDMRTRDGRQNPVVVDSGRVTVTDARVVFNGSKKREWSYDKLEDLRHVGADRTMMKVSNRKTWSGFTYAEAERTRLYVDLAVADRANRRAHVVEAQGQRLHQHEAGRPQAPIPPGPPPVAPQDHTAPSPAPLPAAPGQ